MRPAKVWEGMITEPICHQLEKTPQELIHMLLRSVERRDTALDRAANYSIRESHAGKPMDLDK